MCKGRSYRNILVYSIPVVALVILRLSIPASLCDDAYITCQIAKNLSSGNEMVFNSGEHIYVSTSPAWFLLLAGLRSVLGDVLISVQVLGILCEILLLIAIVHYSRRTLFGMTAGLFAAVLLILNPVFLLTSFSGMELPLFLFVILLTATCLQRQRYTAAIALASCAVWVRFDGIILLGAAIAFILWVYRAQLLKQPRRIAYFLTPGIAILAAYLVFGLILFDSALPVSVKRKALSSPDFLSAEWFAGTIVIAKEYAKAFLGHSAYWYRGGAAFFALTLPLLTGLAVQVVRRDRAMLPLIVLTAAYVAAFISSGSEYARNFPWYFAPMLPAACLSTGIGLVWLIDWLSGRCAENRRVLIRRILQVSLLLIWCVAALGALKSNSDRLRTEFIDVRERVYASAAVWAGNHLDSGAVIAANEIGVIGFFLPPDMSVLDMYGLLRTDSTLEMDGVELVNQVKPDCIFVREHFHLKEDIQRVTGEMYVWRNWGDLNIGIRSDLSAHLERYVDELQQVYDSLDVNREYVWDRSEASK